MSKITKGLRKINKALKIHLLREQDFDSFFLFSLILTFLL